jgi:diadenylate cyclase
LHDGAVIIIGDHIRAARCILPVSNKKTIPPFYGLRHRATVGITEKSDAISIIVSEERGDIAYSYEGRLYENISPTSLSTALESLFK